MAPSVCQRAFSLLEIRFQRPWVGILHRQRKTTGLLSIRNHFLVTSTPKLTQTNMYIVRARGEAISAVGSSGLDARWPWGRAYWRFGPKSRGFESCIHQRKTTGLPSIRNNFLVVSPSKLTQHRENSPVTQTTPEPTLLSKGWWPHEKNPPPPSPCQGSHVGVFSLWKTYVCGMLCVVCVLCAVFVVCVLCVRESERGREREGDRERDLN